MATPTVVANLTTINACNTVTGWSGDTFALEPDFKKEGSNSVSCASTANGANRVNCAVASVALGVEHVRVWFASTIAALWVTGPTRLQLEVTHAGGTAIWNVDPLSLYEGGWLNIVVYGGSVPDSGTAIGANLCTSVNIVQNTSVKPRNSVNTFVDYVRYGDGLIATGGTSGDEIDLAGIAAADAVNGYGVLERINDVYFPLGEIQIGDGATATWFTDAGDVVMFGDKPVSTSLYKLLFTGSGCNVDIQGGLYGSAGSQTFTFDALLANALSISGKQVVKADSVLLSTGQSAIGNVFDKCGQLIPADATFTGNTVTNTTDLNGAMHLALVNNTDNITFSGNTYDVYIDEAGTFNGSGFSHGTNTSDIRYNNAAIATFNTPGNGDTATVTNDSAVMTVVAGQKSISFSVSPDVTGYEWRMYEVTAAGSLLGAVEVAGEETASVNTHEYSHGYSSQAFAIQVIDANYVEVIKYYTLDNLVNITDTLTLTPETNA